MFSGVCRSVALFRFAFVPRLPPSEREQTLRRSRRGFSSRRLTSLTRRGGLPRDSSPISPTLALHPSARRAGLLLASFNVSPRRGGLPRDLSPALQLWRCPLGAALIHPLSAHRIICGLPSGSGETRRLATPKPSAAVSRLSKLAEKLHPCQSIASRLAIARGIRARFSAYGGRLALAWTLPRIRGARRAKPALVVPLSICRESVR